MTHRFLSTAEQELVLAAEYYDGKSEGLGRGFLLEVEAVIGRILRFPEAWGLISGNYRHCNLRRFPYTVVYSIVREDEILFISVFHQSREPLSWKNNL